jgi:hypothetical protein
MSFFGTVESFHSTDASRTRREPTLLRRAHHCEYRNGGIDWISRVCPPTCWES